MKDCEGNIKKKPLIFPIKYFDWMVYDSNIRLSRNKELIRAAYALQHRRMERDSRFKSFILGWKNLSFRRCSIFYEDNVCWAAELFLRRK